MLKAILVLALVAAVQSQGDISNKMMRQIEDYNFRSACWGQEAIDLALVGLQKASDKCMQMEPSIDVEAELKPQRNPYASLIAPKNPFKALLNNDFENLQSLWRNKRAAAPEEGFLKTSEADLIDFLQDYVAWGEDFVTSVGNMTCVMQVMGFITEDREVNLDHYKNSPALAGKDPELKMKFMNAFSDCKAIADSWPQSSLNKNPITKAWGRNMIFFKCAHKAEKAICAIYSMYQWMEKFYGAHSEDENLEDYGLPKDKYDAAAISIMVMDAAASPEEKAVSDFFWGRF